MHPPLTGWPKTQLEHNPEVVEPDEEHVMQAWGEEQVSHSVGHELQVRLEVSG